MADDYRYDIKKYLEMEIELDNLATHQNIYLDMLDARNHTLLLVKNDDLDSLMIGGGAGKYIVVYETNGGEHSFTLKNGASKSNDKVSIVAGGQEGLYEPHIVIEKLDTIKEVMRKFYEGTNLKENFDWQIEY